MDDTSITFRKTTRRGSLDNIEVKLYGANYYDAHPNTRDKIDTNTMFHPRFEYPTQHAFSMSNYHAIDGGGYADGSGQFTPYTVDLVVLTVDTKAFFKEIGFPMEFHLTRLKWVKEEKDKLTGWKGKFEPLKCLPTCFLTLFVFWRAPNIISP